MREDDAMARVVVLGNGASGKSTFARSLGEATGIPTTELDSVFWSADLEPTAPDEWVARQEELTADETWILDGDLGPYDALEIRLRRANAVVLFDLPTRVCAWRAVRRSRQRIDFWRWLLTWRRRCLPQLMAAIETEGDELELFVIRDDADVDRVTSELIGRAGVS
jgi:hypothetical protein